MTEKTIEELQAHIRERIAILEQQREDLVAQANAQLSGLNFTISELKEILGEGPPKPKDAPAPEEEDLEAEQDDPGRDPGDSPATD